MAVRVHCPACRAALLIHNARYLVVVHCHVCGHEFLADGEGRAEVVEVPQPAGPTEYWTEARKPTGDGTVLAFCPMCGELAPESAPACSACGEPLPRDESRPEPHRDPALPLTRRFRRQAQLLGVLWILLAFVIAEQDFWLGGSRVALPAAISGARVAIPPVPLLATVLVCLAAFALVGQFWAVAVGGLVNYIVLFIMVWQSNIISLVLLAALIFLTHITLHQGSSAQFR